MVVVRVVVRVNHLLVRYCFYLLINFNKFHDLTLRNILGRKVRDDQ